MSKLVCFKGTVTLHHLIAVKSFWGGSLSDSPLASPQAGFTLYMKVVLSSTVISTELLGVSVSCFILKRMTNQQNTKLRCRSFGLLTWTALAAAIYRILCLVFCKCWFKVMTAYKLIKRCAHATIHWNCIFPSLMELVFIEFKATSVSYSSSNYIWSISMFISIFFPSRLQIHPRLF